MTRDGISTSAPSPVAVSWASSALAVASPPAPLTCRSTVVCVRDGPLSLVTALSTPKATRARTTIAATAIADPPASPTRRRCCFLRSSRACRRLGCGAKTSGGGCGPDGGGGRGGCGPNGGCGGGGGAGGGGARGGGGGGGGGG